MNRSRRFPFLGVDWRLCAALPLSAIVPAPKASSWVPHTGIRSVQPAGLQAYIYHAMPSLEHHSTFSPRHPACSRSPAWYSFRRCA
ncbi:hypothetical protein KC19_11G103700 [Ceratodon purpureus]|uniref:Secreted protein n=1 Tax=Ceratodon purpureus TaxID=3225 RepID=A0A8T0GDM3_CERPU|nr:hypothetical protein KC19_11G103700 [Ceratodon purpureus]